MQNLQFKIGMIVFSNAGHDKNRFYVLMDVKGNFGYIADGKRRKRDSPKAKNLIHLKATKTVIDINTLDTDKKIRRVLQSINCDVISVAE